MKNIMITRLDEYVTDKNLIDDRPRKDKWLVVPYETAEFSGNILAACEMSFPEAITLKLNVKGKYLVYLGLAGINGAVSTGVSFGAEGTKDVIDFVHEMAIPEPHWSPYDFMREYFYKAADLTADDTVTFFKPLGEAYKTSMIAYIRLEEMTDVEYEDYLKTCEGCVNCHFDQDYLCDYAYSSPEEYASRVKMLAGMGKGILFHETFLDDCREDYEKGVVPYLASHAHIDPALIYYREHGQEVRSSIISAAHKMGLKVYAAHRMEVADFFFPYLLDSHNNGMQKKHPEYSCRTRDGRTVKVLSYAYPEVRKKMTDTVLEVSKDYDGVALILHRGLHVAFEQPVIDAVREKYGVDARRLPVSDPRLQDIQCGFMTEFLRELRAALDPSKKINVIVFYDPESSKNFAMDTETWAKEGLVDGIMQGIMRHFEDLDECIDTEGLIDLAKYEKLIGYKQPVKRDYYDGDFEQITKGSEAFLKICNKYGIDYYGTLGWESMSPERTVQLAAAQKKAGVGKFLSWDANHKAKRPPVLCAEKYISRNLDRLENIEMPRFCKFTRVLSIAGTDISAFNPNWKG